MTSTDLLVAGVIGALFAPPARLYEMKAAFGVVSDCVAFAATMEVIMTTTVAMRMTAGRENSWIRVVIAFILFGFYVWVSCELELLTAIQFRAEPGTILTRRFEQQPHFG
jgi:hypothetical protein